MALVATIAGIASVSVAASASFVWLQNSQNSFEFDGEQPNKSKIDDSNEPTETDESSETEGSSFSSQMDNALSSSMTINDLENPNAAQIQKAAQEKAARLQRLLAMAADTEKDEENERRLQEMRDAQEARFEAEEEAKRAREKAEEEARLAEAKAAEKANLEAQAKADEAARLMAIEEQKKKEAERIQIAQEEEARKKKLEEAQKKEVFVLGMKVIKVKTVIGPLATSVPLDKITPFFEIDRVNMEKIDKKGRAITEFVFRSDYIVNDGNPEWGPAILDTEHLCKGDRDHPIIIRVMDHDESGNHVYIGEFQTTINELLNSTAADDDEHSSKVFKLKKDDKTSGKIVVTSANVEKILPANPTVCGMLKLNLKGERFKNFDGTISKSDPFFEVSRIENETGKPILVYRSQHIKNNLWPDWKESIIEMDKLFVNGMDQTAIRFDVYDYESNGTHEFMGSFETTMAGLVKSSETDAPFEMLSREGESNGTIFVEMVEVETQE